MTPSPNGYETTSTNAAFVWRSFSDNGSTTMGVRFTVEVMEDTYRTVRRALGDGDGLIHASVRGLDPALAGRVTTPPTQTEAPSFDCRPCVEARTLAILGRDATASAIDDAVEGPAELKLPVPTLGGGDAPSSSPGLPLAAARDHRSHFDRTVAFACPAETELVRGQHPGGCIELTGPSGSVRSTSHMDARRRVSSGASVPDGYGSDVRTRDLSAPNAALAAVERRRSFRSDAGGGRLPDAASALGHEPSCKANGS